MAADLPVVPDDLSLPTKSAMVSTLPATIEQSPVDYTRIVGDSQLLFLADHHSNPLIMEHLYRYVEGLKQAGITHYGIEASWSQAIRQLNACESGVDLSGVDFGPNVSEYKKRVVLAFLSQGIKIVPIDQKVQDENREEYMFTQLKDVFERQPNAKIALLVGAFHASEGTLRGQASLATRVKRAGFRTVAVRFIGGKTGPLVLEEPIQAAGLQYKEFLFGNDGRYDGVGDALTGDFFIHLPQGSPSHHSFAILPQNAGRYLEGIASGTPQWLALLKTVALPEQWRIMIQSKRFDRMHGEPNAGRTAFIRRAFWVSWAGVAGAVSLTVLGHITFGVGFLLIGIATALVMHVLHDRGAVLPMALIVSDADGRVPENAALLAVRKGLVPVVLRPATQAPHDVKVGGAKGVWTKVEDNALTVYLEVGGGETFARKAAEYIGSLKGYGNIRGAGRLLQSLETTSGKALNPRQLVVLDSVAMTFPAWQDILVVPTEADFEECPVESNVHNAEQFAGAAVKGFIVRWTEKLKSIPRFNEPLLFTTEELEKAGEANIKILQDKGAEVWEIPAGAGKEVRKVNVTASDERTRNYVTISLDDSGLANTIQQIPLGSVVHVKLGGDNNRERILELKKLPPSNMVVFDAQEVREESVARDITEIMFFGANLFDWLQATPQTPEEKQEYQRKVAYGLELGRFEYETMGELSDDIAIVESGKDKAENLVNFSRNREFYKAVRHHAREIGDAQLRAAFLNAVVERLRARFELASAGKRSDLEDINCEILLGRMVAEQHSTSGADQAVLARFARLAGKSSITSQQLQGELAGELKNQECLSAEGKPDAVSTIIELIKLYAGEIILTQVTTHDLLPARTDTTKAILEAA
jgi:hypothetical protein